MNGRLCLSLHLYPTWENCVKYSKRLIPIILIVFKQSVEKINLLHIDNCISKWPQIKSMINECYVYTKLNCIYTQHLIRNTVFCITRTKKTKHVAKWKLNTFGKCSHTVYHFKIVFTPIFSPKLKILSSQLDTLFIIKIPISGSLSYGLNWMTIIHIKLPKIFNQRSNDGYSAPSYLWWYFLFHIPLIDLKFPRPVIDY